MDPLYDPNAVLGWAGERIEERLNRGVVAVPIEGGKVYVGWRLLKAILRQWPSTSIAPRRGVRR